MWLAEFDDPSILGLAKAAKAGGLSGDALYQYLREDIYKGVMLHELGHTVGLRHNFAGSADALNFHDEYWPMRERTITRSPETVRGTQELVYTTILEGRAGRMPKGILQGAQARAVAQFVANNVEYIPAGP